MLDIGTAMPPLLAQNLTKNRRKLLGPGNLGQPLAQAGSDAREALDGGHHVGARDVEVRDRAQV
jgi:hypothetical protein